MTWSTAEVEWEGFPLLLRKPNYPNIWQYQNQLTQLIAIHHILEEVKSNGLPYPAYNDSLIAFDKYIIKLFKKSHQGKLFLIETFGGKRIYYFYTSFDLQIESLSKKIQDQFKVRIQITVKSDPLWNFLRTYPLKLFPD